MGKPNKRGHHSSGSGSPKSNKSNKSNKNNSSSNKGTKGGHKGGKKGKGGSWFGNSKGGNPTGMTFSEAMELYGVDNKTDLLARMKFNPAETTSFSALVDDSGKENNTKNNEMALTKNQQTIQDIFGTELGRKAGKEGLDYWTAELDKGKTIEDVLRGVRSGSEFKERENVKSAFSEANQGSKASEEYIDSKVTAGGGVYDDASGGFKFAADNTWSSPLMTKGNKTYTDELEQVYSDIGLTSGTTSTPAPANTGHYNVGVTHDAAGRPIVTSDTGTGPSGTENTGTGPSSTENAAVNNNYATIEAIEELLDARDTAAAEAAAEQEPATSEFDQFLKFMTALQGLGGFGGSGDQGYGYWGPGGVRPNLGALDNTMSALNAFKFLGANQGDGLKTGSLTGFG